jgi:transcriptional regulatory protein RtcR
MSKTVVIGFLGSTLDKGGKGPKRWERWRPTVSLCQQEDLLVDQLVLLYQRDYKKLLRDVSKDINSVSPETELIPHEINMENPWDFEEVFSLLHDYAVSYEFDQNNEYLIHISTGSHVAQICLFLLTEARYFPARLIQTGPGRGRISHALGTYNIIDLDLSKYDRIATRFHQEWQDDISFLKSGISTRNGNFNDLIERIEKVAANSNEPILLAGPTGAGKSRLARRIYELKKQRRRIEGSFVEVNCATLRGENAMSALFGHVKGAYTGALNARAGLLKRADNGLLFLDEIGELGVDEQAMLLRAIEEKRFLPVGADREGESDFQLICGSNRNLLAECDNGTFREDLLARINLWTFEMPGLRDRPEDIEPNFEYEMDRFSRRSGSRVTINKEAKNRFLNFAVSPKALWSANFRDLNGAVIRMATLAPGGRITVNEVEAEIASLLQRWQGGLSGRPEQLLLSEIFDQKEIEEIDLFDQFALEKVIEVCRRSSSAADAGRTLFNSSRLKKKTANDSDRLRKYLAKFGLDWVRVRANFQKI